MQAIQDQFSDLVSHLSVGEWQTVELTLSAIAGPLHIRPVDRPTVIEVREISVHADDGRVVWAARTLPELQEISVTGPLIVLPRHESCLFFSFGSDPIWELPLPNEIPHAVTIKVVLLIHKDFAAVSEAIAAVYAEMDLMTAQVRTAAAERNRTVRDLLRKSEEQAALIQFERQRHQEILEAERQVWEQRNAELQIQRDAWVSEAQVLRQTLHAWEQSRSWRLTRPLRSTAGFAQKLRKSFD